MSVFKRIPTEYVSVPRKSCADWWPRPYSELRAAATEGTDGLVIHVTPKKTIEKADGSLREVDDYPYVVRGTMTFYQAGKIDGYDREDVASLHTQGW